MMERIIRQCLPHNHTFVRSRHVSVEINSIKCLLSVHIQSTRNALRRSELIVTVIITMPRCVMLVAAEMELNKTFCRLRDFLLSETIALFSIYHREKCLNLKYKWSRKVHDINTYELDFINLLLLTLASDLKSKVYARIYLINNM